LQEYRLLESSYKAPSITPNAIIEVFLTAGAAILNAIKLGISLKKSGALTGLITWIYASMLAVL
jgi:hypothetical protein